MESDVKKKIITLKHLRRIQSWTKFDNYKEWYYDTCVCKKCCDCSSFVYMQHPLPLPLRTNYLRSFWWFYFHLTSNSTILKPGLSNHTITSCLKCIESRKMRARGLTCCININTFGIKCIGLYLRSIWYIKFGDTV